MAHSPSAHLCPFTVIPQSGKCLGKCCNIREASLLHGRDQSPGHSPLPARLVITKTKATRDDRNSKPKSMICADCDGNGNAKAMELTRKICSMGGSRQGILAGYVAVGERCCVEAAMEQASLEAS
ncbi:hypothetical protein SAY86_002782 [Trapa natans]|uniref:Uncharacterized protein n=1 Tax=Trapa natans TaxID=22666 RepID=A0AAN7R534_TRANT|nr:hypothetical protein SAY86_002782 [Trapa natans]